jgi:hypothetical protein
MQHAAAAAVDNPRRRVPRARGYLGATMSLGHAIAVFAVSAYALMIIAVVLLPETRGRDLYAFD